MKINDILGKAKGLNKEQLNEFLDSLSDDEQQVIKDYIIMQHKVNYTFKDDDFSDYTEDEKELKERIESIKEAIESYSTNDLYYTKESIESPYILNVLAHCIKDTYNDLDAERLNELIGNYNRINEFINNNDNYDEIISMYGDIVEKNANGFYEVNNAVIDKVIEANDINIEYNDSYDNENKKKLTEAINLTWENKKEILDPSKINELSENQNGITFKQFLFCEEYLKRGKIKPTCEYLGIARQTAYTWLDDENVKDYLKKRKNEIKQETDNTFLNTYKACFTQLERMINGDYMENTDKIKAIDTFLKHYANMERIKQPSTTYED